MLVCFLAEYMLSFLNARDTMHQNQWLAVLEELGGLENVHPIPNNFPQSMENQDYNYTFMSTNINKEPSNGARWTTGKSMDGKGEFKFTQAQPPELSDPMPEGHAQKEQMRGPLKRAAAEGKDLIDKVKNKLS